VIVELLYFDGCPNLEVARAQLQAALVNCGATTRVELVRMTGDATAQAMKFLGSPSVRINGRDVDPDAEASRDFGLQCRVYTTSAGLQGTPPKEWITAAIVAAQAKKPT